MKKKNNDQPNDAPSVASEETKPSSGSLQPKYELVDAEIWRRAHAALEEITALREKVARLQADFDNSRKRLEREKEEALKYANTTLLEDLLPVIDNFELGLTAAETATDSKSIAMGMKMVKVQLDKFLEACGVESIQAVGSPFDPNLHEAVSQKKSNEHPEGTVIEQSRKGYKLKDRLIRPASVIVTENPESAK